MPRRSTRIARRCCPNRASLRRAARRKGRRRAPQGRRPARRRPKRGTSRSAARGGCCSLVEAASRAGGTIGYALDRTEIETAESELARHINAHGQVLESIHAAVAIYGADKRLKFFNSAFARLWALEEDWLAGGPSLDELLERLRERRRLPEQADARAFKRQQIELFTSLIEPESELLHLPGRADPQHVGLAASAGRPDFCL